MARILAGSLHNNLWLLQFLFHYLESLGNNGEGKRPWIQFSNNKVNSGFWTKLCLFCTLKEPWILKFPRYQRVLKVRLLDWIGTLFHPKNAFLVHSMNWVEYEHDIIYNLSTRQCTVVQNYSLIWSGFPNHVHVSEVAPLVARAVTRWR
jgi:hypothetical protein